MPECKLYVGNLYCMASKEQLRNLFSQFGPVRRIDLIPGSGYGYVEMMRLQDAQRAVNALEGTEFLERQLKVKFADLPLE